MAKPGLRVLVKFDPHVPLDLQGRALLAMEKFLRENTNLDIRVTKNLMADDSKLRILMTPEMRAKL